MAKVKTMSGATLDKWLEEVAAHNELDEMLYTPDGNAWKPEDRLLAMQHAEKNELVVETYLTTAGKTAIADAAVENTENPRRTVKAIVADIKDADSIEKVNELAEGDERTTVVREAARRIKQLTPAEEEPAAEEQVEEEPAAEEPAAEEQVEEEPAAAEEEGKGKDSGKGKSNKKK